MREGTLFQLMLMVLLVGSTAMVAAVSSDDPFDGVAFEWDYEGDDDVGTETHGEGRSLLAYGKPRRFGFFIRAVVLNNINNDCASFWQLSRPRGTGYPSRAYRRSTRQLVDQVTFTDMNLNNGRLRTLRMICRATRILGKNNNNQRKIIRMETIAAIPVDRQAEYNSLMQGYIRSGLWSEAVCDDMQNAFLDLTKWCPRRATPIDDPVGV